MKHGGRIFRRRDFIRLAGTTTAGAFFLPWLRGKAPAADPGEWREAGFPWGLAVGDVTPDGAVVWLRAKGESKVSVHYGKNPDLTKYTAAKPALVTKETDFTAKVSLDNLEPGTNYYYRAMVSGERPGPICRFLTAPRPDDPANVRFAFSGDTRERFKPFSIMDSIRAMGPDFFLHLGDTIYADKEGVATRLPQFWAKHVSNRSDLPTQRLFSETSLYVTWDDHEVADNYHPANPLAPIGQKAFFDYWSVRQDPRDPKRLYRSFRRGKAAELFILDTRQYRDPVEGTILGKKQREWFLEALSSSDAWFKFIATSVPFSSPNSDKWGGFPEERDEIVKFIGAKRITGIIFLSADVHYAAVSRVPGGLGLKEFIVGPLAAPMGRTSGTAKRFEFFSKDSFNYGMVKVDAEAKPPHAEVKILDESNRLLYQTRLEAPHT